MSKRSVFDRPPGTGLPLRLEQIGRISFEVVRPQLLLIKDNCFGAGGVWPEHAFPRFLRLPVIAGYILGLVDFHRRHEKLEVTEEDVLRSVIDVSNHYYINSFDVQMCVHYTSQQSIFKFGLDIGASEVARVLAEQAKVGRSEFVLLSSICLVFLRYEDARTLILNLRAFCNLHGVPQRDDHTLTEIVERWDVHKQYDMRPR